MTESVNFKVPPVKTYGFSNGAQSARQAAHASMEADADAQNNLNKEHTGGADLDGKIVIPQANLHGVESAGPNGGNSTATSNAATIIHSRANAQYDNQVDIKNATSTGGSIVAKKTPMKSYGCFSGGKKKRKTRTNKKNKHNKKTIRRKLGRNKNKGRKKRTKRTRKTLKKKSYKLKRRKTKKK